MTSDVPYTVIKIGGALLSEAARIGALWDGIRAIHAERHVVVVHGGGPQLTAMARRLGHEPRIVQGRRVTTDLDLNIMHWTVRGVLNTTLVASAATHDVPSVGLSGVDGAMIRVQKRPPWDINGERVDFGWVGDVQRVDPRLLHVLCGAGFVPVVAPIAVDAHGQTYNVNADTVAQSIAAAVSAEEFLLVTETGGIRRDPQDARTLLSAIDAPAYHEGAQQGWIRGGMLVKLRVAFEARGSGIPAVRIVAPDGIVDREAGTTIVA